METWLHTTIVCCNKSSGGQLSQPRYGDRSACVLLLRQPGMSVLSTVPILASVQCCNPASTDHCSPRSSKAVHTSLKWPRHTPAMKRQWSIAWARAYTVQAVPRMWSMIATPHRTCSALIYAGPTLTSGTAIRSSDARL